MIHNNLPHRHDQFLITGYPRSGTQYISRCLRRFGYGIAEEEDYEYSHGVVGWTHAPFADQFRAVALQMRDPLKAISSAQTINLDVWEKVADRFIKMPRGRVTPLKMAVYAYPRWFKLADKNAGMVYRVEDINKMYKDLFGYLKLEIPKKWTNQVPKNQNTREGLYKPLTWKDIEKVNKTDYRSIRKIAKEFKYA